MTAQQFQVDSKY